MIEDATLLEFVVRVLITKSANEDNKNAQHEGLISAITGIHQVRQQVRHHIHRHHSHHLLADFPASNVKKLRYGKKKGNKWASY